MNNLPKIRIEEIMGQRKTKLLSDQYQLFIIIISGKSEPVVYLIEILCKENSGMNNVPTIRIEDILGQGKTKLLSDRQPVVYCIKNYKKKNI